ncbi:hypothetical protein DPMN_094768 [Dreissena polymorpha]|uniref:Uncharacterized protein n=2 Tax=Dreissena polymorpha TaxID=45954 RepID=A0A9D4L6B8_DREPO|nr:hypothetical protein DPMN_094768 [Dreissena polymorpha]
MTIFYELGFRVQLVWNASAERMRRIVREAASLCDNKNSECFVLAISSHGTETCKPGAGPNGANLYEHAVNGSDDQLVFLFELTQILEKETSLRGKPKICIIQACRNTHHDSKSQKDMLDTGIAIGTLGDDESDSKKKSSVSESEYSDIKQFFKYDSDDESHSSSVAETDGPEHLAATGISDSVPIDCPEDFLIVHPVQPHKMSFRGSKSGSFFVRSLFDHRKILEKESLLTYLTEVAGSIANKNIKFPSIDKKDLYKMCITLTHRLKSDVTFHNNTFTRVIPTETYMVHPNNVVMSE